MSNSASVLTNVVYVRIMYSVVSIITVNSGFLSILYLLIMLQKECLFSKKTQIVQVSPGMKSFGS